MAGRASVEFYVGLALKARGEKGKNQEEAFVIRTFRNGLAVFVSKWVHVHQLSIIVRLIDCSFLTIVDWAWKAS